MLIDFIHVILLILLFFAKINDSTLAIFYEISVNINSLLLFTTFTKVKVKLLSSDK